LFLERLFC